MTVVTVRQPAPMFSRWRPGAFADRIGHDIEFAAPGKSGAARLLAAKVAADGSYVILTVEAADGAIDLGDIVGLPRQPS
jgi:hypothetical protein